jgi:hypothetical protein
MLNPQRLHPHGTPHAGRGTRRGQGLLRAPGAAGRPGGLLQLRRRGVPRHRPDVRAARAAGGHRAGEGLRDSIFDSDDQLFGENRQVAHYFRFNEIRTGRTYGPHDTPDAPPTGPEIDVRWEDAYRIDPNASIADYARYDDKAVYEHAVAFNDAYAELLAHLEIAFNGRPRFMILGIPAMLRLRDLAERLYHNPHPDPDKGSRGYFASATFEIDHNQIERGHEIVSVRVHTASLNAGEPVDLSAVAPS